MPERQKAHILDCTIRDGSYVVDFQFTKEDTYIVAKGLATAGIGHIEVGHGLGLGASRSKGTAAESDEEYIRVACEAARGAAKVGSFFIPGIGHEDDIRAAHDAGLGFIRLGMDVDDFAKLEPYVDLAKTLGLEVWGNMMKTYLVTPKEFGRIAEQVGDFGVDVIALVDSAGGMTPDDVSNYTLEARARTRTPLAFHGHDNLTLAVANCLRFIEAGGLYVDGSLAGLGRSGGNAATELLAVLLSRNNALERPVDWQYLIEFADSVMELCAPGHVRPRAAEIATGLNYFHSGFSGVVEAALQETGASLYKTLLHLPKNSRKTVSSQAALSAARKSLESQSPRIPASGASFERLERTQPKTLEELAERLRVDRGKFPQPRVMTIAYVPDLTQPRFGPLRKNAGSIVAHIEVGGLQTYNKVKAHLGEVAEFWLLDNKLARLLPHSKASNHYLYDDDDVIAQALADTMQMLGIKEASLIGCDLVGIHKLEKNVRLCQVTEPVDAIVACDPSHPAGSEVIDRVRDGGAVLVLRPGALSSAGLNTAHERGVIIRRLDCGAALVAEVERILATHKQFQSGAGSRKLPNGHSIVAGGVIGRQGDIVVDDWRKPSFVLGIADGVGGIRPVEGETLNKMQEWIIQDRNL
ncbi:hypothetical protein LMS44_18860 [Halomonas profundus]|nr:hypothetical protein LMS44_18860 [Halomonas profundus]